MFHGFFLGILGGVVAAKVASRCRDGGGGFGPGRHGFGHGFGPGFGRFGIFRLVRELNLTPEQWHEGREILFELRQTMREGREDMRGSIGPLLSILAEGQFDAARAEEIAKRHDASFHRVRKDAISALEKLHRILTPEQRDRLRRYVENTQNR